MKLNFCAFVCLSSLLLFVSSCSEYSRSNRAVSTQEQQLTDNQIIKIMMTVDKGEIAASQVATKKRVSLPVDAYAKYLIEQHQINLEELTQLSKQLGLEPKESAISSSLENEGEHDLKTLGEVQDNAFDKEYINAMVKDHQAGLELIETKLYPQTKNPQLKVFVEKFRHMVADHLEKGIEIQRNL